METVNNIKKYPNIDDVNDVIKSVHRKINDNSKYEMRLIEALIDNFCDYIEYRSYLNNIKLGYMHGLIDENNILSIIYDPYNDNPLIDLSIPKFNILKYKEIIQLLLKMQICNFLGFYDQYNILLNNIFLELCKFTKLYPVDEIYVDKFVNILNSSNSRPSSTNSFEYKKNDEIVNNNLIDLNIYNKYIEHIYDCDSYFNNYNEKWYDYGIKIQSENTIKKRNTK